MRRGLTQARKTLPPKYFYDDRGSHLFDAICDLPEYYLTRTEHALLREIADDVIAAARPVAPDRVRQRRRRARRARLLDALVRDAGARRGTCRST